MGTEDPDLEPELRDLLRAAGDESDVPHLDPVLLAEYIDGTLTGPARDQVELHLARCSESRLAASLAADLAHDTGQPVETTVIEEPALNETPVDDKDSEEATPLWGRSRRSAHSPVHRRTGHQAWWLAAAAMLAVVLGIALLRSPSLEPSESLAALGVSPEVVASADPDLVRKARRAAAGQWPAAPSFDDFDQGAGQPVLRSGEASDGAALDGPVPLSPRWSVVDDTRPEFSWLWNPSSAADSKAAADSATVRHPERFEILVVDLEEQPVAFVEGGPPTQAPSQSSAEPEPGLAGGLRLRATIAESEPALQRGSTYAWKVNVYHGDEWLASDYVPFRVLGNEESARLEAELTTAGEAAFLRAVAFASHGLDRRALDELATLPATSTAREQLARSLLARRRLPPSFDAAEIEELLAP